MKNTKDLEVGDTIECKDLDDMIRLMYELSKVGVQTDWDCEEIIKALHILHVTETEEPT